MRNLYSANVIWDMIRSFLAFLDLAVYWLLNVLYNIFFRVATMDLFSNGLVRNFYGRIQLILGVFMLFKITISIIQGIINPDAFLDKKQGFSGFISRMIFVLVMLTLLSPLNIPSPKNDYEKHLNNNGILFGTLYSFQDRILQNNTLGRLILGSGGETESSSNKNGDEKIQQSANIFTATILKTFINYNVKEANGDPTDPESRVCEVDQDIADLYEAADADVNEILGLINASCEMQEDGFFHRIAARFKRIVGGDVYLFAYLPVVSTIVGGVFCFIILTQIIDIAVRMVKLFALRLIAPIPIMSYIDPKSQKDGAFASWMKSLTSTYLSLFIRLSVMYFIFFIIQSIILDPPAIFQGGILGAISMVFVFLGLFRFVQIAPKFFKDSMGTKGATATLGGVGLAAAVGAAREGGNFRDMRHAYSDATRANVQAYNQGKAGSGVGEAFTFGRDSEAKLLTDNDKMTAYAMHRGRSNLRGMGVNQEYVDSLKDNMLANQARSDVVKDLYTRFTHDPTKVDRRQLQTEWDELSKLRTAPDSSGRDRTITNGLSLDKASDEQIRSVLYEGYNRYTEIAGSYERNNKKADDMLKKYGANRGYEAKHRN